LIKSKTKKGCLLVLLGALIAITLIIAALYIGFKNTTNVYLQRIGISDIGELSDIIDAINEPVEESQLVVGGFNENNYLSAKTKLINSQIDIFNVISGNVSIEKINSTIGYTPILSVALTQAELGALIANAVQNLDTSAISANIEFEIDLISLDMAYIDENNAIFECVIKIDTSDFKSELGLLQSFIPDAIYLSFTANITVAENYSVSVSGVQINKLSASKNEKVLNVICAIIKSGNSSVEEYSTLNLTQDTASVLIIYINEFMQKITGTVIFTSSGIELNIAG